MARSMIEVVTIGPRGRRFDVIPLLSDEQRARIEKGRALEAHYNAMVAPGGPAVQEAFDRLLRDRPRHLRGR